MNVYEIPASYFNQEYFSDGIIQVLQHQFYVQKSILALGSSTFRSLFSDNWSESKQERLQLKEDRIQSFIQILRHFYSLPINITEDNVCELLEMEQYYGLTNGFQNLCLNFLEKNLDVDNVCWILKKTLELDSHNAINQACENFILENFQSIADNPTHLYELPLVFLEKLLPKLLYYSNVSFSVIHSTFQSIPSERIAKTLNSSWEETVVPHSSFSQGIFALLRSNNVSWDTHFKALAPKLISVEYDFHTCAVQICSLFIFFDPKTLSSNHDDSPPRYKPRFPAWKLECKTISEIWYPIKLCSPELLSKKPNFPLYNQIEQLYSVLKTQEYCYYVCTSTPPFTRSIRLTIKSKSNHLSSFELFGKLRKN